MKECLCNDQLEAKQSAKSGHKAMKKKTFNPSPTEHEVYKMPKNANNIGILTFISMTIDQFC